jgi:hypothetical protein
MECRDTSKGEVVQFPHLSLDLLQDLNEKIGVILDYNKGHGIITLQLKDGEIPVIDWQMRQFRKTPRKK